MSKRLAIIAGNGEFPIEAASRAHALGYEVFAIGLRNETDPRLEKVVREITWLKLGQLGKLLKALQRYAVSEAIFIGGVSRVKFFHNFLPDLKMLAVVAKAGLKKDDALLRAIASEVEAIGVEVIGSDCLLSDLIVQAGYLTDRTLSRDEVVDALCGWDAAKALGARDEGQTAVVSNGKIVSLECERGTDATIERAGEAAGNRSLTIVKTAKPQQDLRLDLPAVGIKTLAGMHKVGATALILEAGKAMILGPKEFAQAAHTYGISVFAAKDKGDLEAL